VAQQWVLRVVIRPMEDGPGCLPVCPDLPGCHADGATPGDALDTVRAGPRLPTPWWTPRSG
jgi:hypothetical protein